MELAMFRNNLLSKFNLIHLIPNFIAELPLLSIFRAIFSRLFGRANQRLTARDNPIPQVSAARYPVALVTRRSCKRVKSKPKRLRKSKSNTRNRTSSNSTRPNGASSLFVSSAIIDRAAKGLNQVKRELQLANEQVNVLRDSLRLAELAAESERLKSQATDEKLQRELSRSSELSRDIARWTKLYSTAQDELESKRRELDITEATSKQTVAGLVHELKRLQDELTAKSLAQHQKQLIAEENERRLAELRENLATILPGVETGTLVDGQDWVPQYLEAVKRLLESVHQLKCQIERKKSSLSKSSPNSRFSSPTFSGRLSKGEFCKAIFFFKIIIMPTVHSNFI